MTDADKTPPACGVSRIVSRQPPQEYWFDEGCYIAEWFNDESEPETSVVRARVLPGTQTAWHRLSGVTERYVILAGDGFVEITDLPGSPVSAGDIVHIAPGDAQRIRNDGPEELVFLAICTPRFTVECYSRLDED
ncbi:MAG: cupin domain-containing protein [Burkholderiaceae bacterium]